jgi:exonuclease III
MLMGPGTLLMAVLIMSLNICGLCQDHKRDAFKQWLQHHCPDIVCLQETHAVSDDEMSCWFRSIGYECASSLGTNRSRGVAILYRSSVQMVRLWRDDVGRWVQSEFSYQGTMFRVVSLFAPNRNPDRDSFIENMTDNSYSSGTFVLEA